MLSYLFVKISEMSVLSEVCIAGPTDNIVFLQYFQ